MGLTASRNGFQTTIVFHRVRDRLAAVLSKARFAPAVPLNSGDRRTWDEQNAAVVSERSRFDEAMSDIADGRRSEAKAKLQQLIAQQPDMVDARIQLAVLLAEERSSAEAMEHLEAAEAAQPHRGRLLNIASVYARLCKVEDAERILDIVQKERADEPRIWMTRSGIAEVHGDLTRAIDYCRRWLECGGVIRSGGS